MHSVTAVMILATLHKTAPTRFLPQEHHSTKTGLVPGHNTPTHKGTDHTPPTRGRDMGDISAGHNHANIPTVTGAAALTDNRHCTPYPATIAAGVTLSLMDAPVTTHTMTYYTGRTAPHLRLATSPTDITHATFHGPELVSLQELSLHFLETQPMRKVKPHPRPSTPHTSHHSKNVIMHVSL